MAKANSYTSAAKTAKQKAQAQSAPTPRPKVKKTFKAGAELAGSVK